VIKASDLQTNIKEHGYERGVVITLNLALEELSAMRVLMRQLTELQSQLVDRVGEFMQIGAGLQREIDTLRRGQEEVDGA
jgi:hypothetical protein